MTDLFGAFARGHQQGDEVGGRMAARGLRRRVAQAEEDFRAGTINADQYEQALREAEGQGMARFRDVASVTEGLRTRAFGDLDRRDARAGTQALLDKEYDTSARHAGSIAARNGDMAQGLATRRWMNDLDAGKLVRDMPGGVRDYSEAYNAQSRATAEMGDLPGSEKQYSEGFRAMEATAGQLAQQAYTAFKGGNRDLFVAAGNQMLRLRGVPLEIREGTDGKWNLVDETGATQKTITSEREMSTVLYQMGQGNATALTDALSEFTAADKAERERYANFEEKAFDATMQIAQDFQLQSDTQRMLAQSIGRMSSGGVQTITTSEDGSLLLNIDGQMVRAVPPGQSSNPDDPDAAATTQWVFTDARDPSKPVGVANEVEDNIGDYALALAQAQEESGNERDFTQLQTQLSTVWDTFHQMTGGQGPSPLTQGFMRRNSRLDPAEAEAAIGGFMDTFGTLEGTGDNPTSSAVGVGQFVDATALDVARRNFPDNPVTEQFVAASRIADRKAREAAFARVKTANPDFMRELTREYAMDNAEILANRRIAVTPLTLYAMHHFGPGGGPKFLRALSENPDASVDGVLSTSAISENEYVMDPSRGGGTLRGVVKDWYTRQPELFADMPPAAVKALIEGEPAAPATEAAPEQDVAAAEQDVEGSLQQLIADREELAAQIRAAEKTALGSTPGVETRTRGYSVRDPRVASDLVAGRGQQEDPNVVEARQILAQFDEAIAARRNALAATQTSSTATTTASALAEQMGRSRTTLGLPPPGAPK